MNLFERRTNLKPYEYPELLGFMKAIRQSYWVVDEFNFTQDIQDFHSVSNVERSAIKNSILAIAQIEVAVKTFWGDLYSHIPKPEIGMVGYSFAESEVRHMEAYSELLDLLGLNAEFATVTQIPEIQGRIKYLNKYLAGAKSDDPKKYVLSLLLFSVFIENVSLFSQFLILMSFNRDRNIFKGISNVIQATSQEEAVHGQFGMALVNILREERPDIFDEDMETRIINACKKAQKAESKILDWIFEAGELEFLPRVVIDNFILNRYNESVEVIGLKPIFDVDQDVLKSVRWFDEETTATSHVDFFYKRPTTYTKFTQTFDPESMWS